MEATRATEVTEATSGGRTVDQMVQAARSCKQNIAEGGAATASELAARADEMCERISRIAWGIRKRKGW